MKAASSAQDVQYIHIFNNKCIERDANASSRCCKASAWPSGSMAGGGAAVPAASNFAKPARPSAGKPDCSGPARRARPMGRALTVASLPA